MEALKTLVERGFTKQYTHEEEIKELLEKEKIAFYLGIDPTADSLHVGHFVGLMASMHLQKDGHIPIILVGGGTAKIGDPSGKTEMRKMLDNETMDNNIKKIEKQLRRFIDFDNGKAILENNDKWLSKLNYIDFMKDIGVHFSVNRMLSAECFKQRLEKGLSFLEFNYMLMQGYDFLELYRRHNCLLEIGGDDQWSNILAGTDLVRKKESKAAYGMTFRLLTNSSGEKMGKTVGGAVWLDAEKTSPYDFYQYWRNVDDADVEMLLSILTFIPMDEVKELASLKDSEINKAKVRLAFEITKIVHGEEEAKKAMEATQSLFGSGNNTENIPSVEISKDALDNALLDALLESKIIPSKSEGRRLIVQGGITLGENKISDPLYIIKDSDFENNEVIIKIGKKKFYKIVLK